MFTPISPVWKKWRESQAARDLPLIKLLVFIVEKGKSTTVAGIRPTSRDGMCTWDNNTARSGAFTKGVRKRGRLAVINARR